MAERAIAVAMAASVGLLALSGCAHRPVLAPEHETLAFPEFVFPVIPAATGDGTSNRLHRQAWAQLQARDLAGAEQTFARLLRLRPGFVPALTGLGWVELGYARPERAVAEFDRALALRPDYVSALVGRGDALAAVGRLEDAAASLRAALAVDGTLGDVRRRLEVLTLRQQQAELAEARRATERGDLAAARQAYVRALAVSPDSAFIYRELAAVERQAGDLSAAAGHARHAVGLDPADARAWVCLGEILETRKEFDAALAAFERASALDPNPAATARLERVAALAWVAKLPPQLQNLTEQRQITRGALAALVGIRLPAVLAKTAARQVVVTDTRDHWAARWILPVVQAGVMDPYPNHAFQPDAGLTRGELAEVVRRLLLLIGQDRPADLQRWQAARPRMRDVGPDNRLYPAAALAVAAAITSLTDDGAFGPMRPVSGAEAAEVVRRLEALTR